MAIQGAYQLAFHIPFQHVYKELSEGFFTHRSTHSRNYCKFLHLLAMSLQNTTRCEALWREDGDVVLLAEDTLFRIHSKELAEQSPFFRNMFSLPPPDNSTYDGCPLFTLPGEKANDVRAMLLVLLNPK